MKKPLIFSLASITLWLGLASVSGAAETRCGWLVNPTPANWWLNDADGSWGISYQGGYAAEGIENLPELDPEEFVNTNGNYGYGCACLEVLTDPEEMIMLNIISGKPLPLAICLEDPALPQM